MGFREDQAVPGRPLNIPADNYNAWNRAAKALGVTGLPNTGGGNLDQQRDVVFIKNTIGRAVIRFDALGIDGWLIDPSTNIGAFDRNPILVGVMPAIPDHVGKFAICLEPIADGGVGRAVVAGIVLANVKITSLDDVAVEIQDGDTELISGGSGSAQILDLSGMTGTGQYAVIRLGTPTTSIVRCRILDEVFCGEQYSGVVVASTDGGTNSEDDGFGNATDGGDTDSYDPSNHELIIIRNLALPGSEGHSLTIGSGFQYKTYLGVDSGQVDVITNRRIIDIRAIALAPGCADVYGSSSSSSSSG